MQSSRMHGRLRRQPAREEHKKHRMSFVCRRTAIKAGATGSEGEPRASSALLRAAKVSAPQEHRGSICITVAEPCGEPAHPPAHHRAGGCCGRCG